MSVAQPLLEGCSQACEFLGGVMDLWSRQRAGGRWVSFSVGFPGASSTLLCSNLGVLLPEHLPGQTPWMLVEKIVLKPGRELRPNQGSAKPMLEANPGIQISLIVLKPSFSHTETVHFVLLWSSSRPVKYMISLVQDLGELLLLSIIRMYLLYPSGFLHL